MAIFFIFVRAEPVFSEAVMLSPIGASTAELAFRGRWELARSRAIKDKYAQGRVGQNDCAFSIYLNSSAYD